MTFHIQERPDLAEGQVFPVAQRHQFIKGAQQLVSIPQDFPLIQALASARNHLGEEVKRVNVLEDVGLAVGDEDHVKLIQGLVDKADIVLLDGRMLSAALGELRERGKEGFDTGSGHLSKLPGEDSFPSSGTDRGCEDHLRRLAEWKLIVYRIDAHHCDKFFGLLLWVMRR